MSRTDRSDRTRLQGVLAACLTPFGPDGGPDLDALRAQIEFAIPDADAISVGAVEASEYALLAPADRDRLLCAAAEIVDGRRPLVLGVSATSVTTVLDLCDRAADLGADLVQVLAPGRPWGGEPTAAELVRYFTHVGERSPLPIVAYHHPTRGADPSAETWAALADIPAVVAIKDSARDIARIGRVIELVGDRASYLSTMQPLLGALLVGAAGGTMPPPGTRIAARVVAAVAANDVDEARRWQRMFLTFPGAWGSYGLPPVMKAAMQHFGIDVGTPGFPYDPVSAADHEAIGRFLRSNGLIGESSVPSVR